MSDDSSGDYGGGDFGGGDSVTETSTKGWLNRILGSIVAAIIGIVLVIGSIVLLWWNEGRAVEAIRALDQGSRQVVEVIAASVNPATDGKLVHLSGMMEGRAPVHDSVFGLGGDNLLRLKRTVEMYQWTEHKTTHSHKNLGGSETTDTTYSYQKEWSEHAVDSGRFHESNNHHNPPMPLTSATFDTTDARLGGYRIDRLLLAEVKAFTPYDTRNAQMPAGYRRSGDALYHGQDESSPAIGDIRVHFAAVPAQDFSVVAAQISGALAPFHAANGYKIALADAGTVTAAAMFKEKAEEEALWTWIWRAVGFVVMLFGLLLMSSPLSVLVGVIPLLEELVGIGTFLLALIVSVPLTLTVIALAWIVHRPLIGGGLILAALASGYLLRQLHRRPPPQQPVPMQQPPQQSPLQRAAQQPPQQPTGQPTHFLPPGYRVD